MPDSLICTHAGAGSPPASPFPVNTVCSGVSSSFPSAAVFQQFLWHLNLSQCLFPWFSLTCLLLSSFIFLDLQPHLLAVGRQWTQPVPFSPSSSVSHQFPCHSMGHLSLILPPHPSVWLHILVFQALVSAVCDVLSVTCQDGACPATEPACGLGARSHVCTLKGACFGRGWRTASWLGMRGLCFLSGLSAALWPPGCARGL